MANNPAPAADSCHAGNFGSCGNGIVDARAISGCLKDFAGLFDERHPQPIIGGTFQSSAHWHGSRLPFASRIAAPILYKVHPAGNRTASRVAHPRGVIRVNHAHKPRTMDIRQTPFPLYQA